MVPGVFMGPVLERRKGQEPGEVADDAIPAATPEQRPVSGVVKDNEHANQKPGRGHGEEQTEQVGNLRQRPHQDQPANVGNE